TPDWPSHRRSTRTRTVKPSVKLSNGSAASCVTTGRKRDWPPSLYRSGSRFSECSAGSAGALVRALLLPLVPRASFGLRLPVALFLVSYAQIPVVLDFVLVLVSYAQIPVVLDFVLVLMYCRVIDSRKPPRPVRRRRERGGIPWLGPGRAYFRVGPPRP